MVNDLFKSESKSTTESVDVFALKILWWVTLTKKIFWQVM